MPADPTPAPDDPRVAAGARLDGLVQPLQETWALDRALADHVWALLKRHQVTGPQPSEEAASAALTATPGSTPAAIRAALDGHAVRWASDGDHGQHVWLECSGCDWTADTDTPEHQHYADLACAAIAHPTPAETDEAARDLSLLLADLDQHGHHGHPLYRTRARLDAGWSLTPPARGEPAPRRAVVEQAVGGVVHVASEAAAAVDAVMDALGDGDGGEHDGPGVTEPPC